MRLHGLRAALLGVVVFAVCTGSSIALAAPHARRPAPAARAAAGTPDIGCTLDLRQRPHFSKTGRRRGVSEVTWKVTVKCYWGKIVRGKFISSGVPAVVAFMHVRMALYRNGTQGRAVFP